MLKTYHKRMLLKNSLMVKGQRIKQMITNTRSCEVEPPAHLNRRDYHKSIGIKILHKRKWLYKPFKCCVYHYINTTGVFQNPMTHGNTNVCVPDGIWWNPYKLTTEERTKDIMNQQAKLIKVSSKSH